MSTHTDPSAFYAEKGLKRTTITLRPSTVEILDEKRKAFSKTCTQGEIVDAMTDLYVNNPDIAALVNQAVENLLANKKVKKAGRKATTLAGKMKSASPEQLAEIEKMLNS
ncbi:hypothetical protein [Acinetobacter brisouii]|uniref:hypothetical protein n=1 Tax=Acinetobacter brisouii TaxID=396323 RepID=UPI00124C0522|nr:hypothetical protein [Acinetobacter brisouii]